MSTSRDGQDALSPAKRSLLAIQSLKAELQSLKNRPAEPVAIIGMGCRYPGAADPGAMWRMLCEGVDAVGEVPADRWDIDEFYSPDPAARGKMATRRGGFLEHLDQFDAEFFGISPREAPHVDPRQRIVLEIAWEALEAAGIPPSKLAGSRTGVYVATLTNDYDALLFSDLTRAEIYSGIGTAESGLANRLSYFLDLQGPSVSLDTACSGSLVGIHLACESLRNGDTTLALVGGVSINLLPKSNVFFSRAGALAPDGRCKAFDAQADGIVRSDGAGLLVLKLLSEALRDGDPIVATIRGSAVNHDGRSNGIMAPNGEAQKAMLSDAYRRAGVLPAEVQYVEAHGTGTRLGDPIEVLSLGSVLSEGRHPEDRCALGSLKTNIGHTEAAAGVGGVIKTALALQNRLLPPSLHFHDPNPLIPFDDMPLAVQRELGPWPSPSRPLVAGVSSFGFGGTNAHIVMAEAPAPGHSQRAGTAPPYLLLLSARSPEALQALAGRFHELLLKETADPSAICYTASVRRDHLEHRLAVVGSSREELAAGILRAAAESQTPLPSPSGGDPVFVFSGQGSHWPGMGRELSCREPVFRAALEDCDRLFAEHLPWSLLAELAAPADTSRLNDTRLTQPAIFSIQVALAALWKSWGVAPQAVVGHSLGEVAAAHVAGVLSLEDSVHIVYQRSRLMQTVAGRGRTAVVGLPREEVRELLAEYGDAATIAGNNSPTASVLAGSPDTVACLVASLDERGVFARMLPGVDIAFHSPQMDPLREQLVALLAGLAPRDGVVPIISSVTGDVLHGAAFGAGYWGRNLREPFLFDTATTCLLDKVSDTMVEVAPHPILSSAILQTARQVGATSATVYPSLRRDEPEAATMLASLGSLYERGRDVLWSRLHGSRRECVPLPSYPWQAKRYWFDQLPGSQSAFIGEVSRGHPLVGQPLESALPASPEGGTVTFWDTDLSQQAPSWLADHRVRGVAVLPGAACLEMALAAAQRLAPGRRTVVAEVAFERVLALPEEATRQVQLVFTSADGGYAFSLHSRPRSATGDCMWTRHASGKVHFADQEDAPAAVSGAPFEPRDAVEIRPAAHYRTLRANGLEYGPGFQAIVQLWRGQGEAWGHLELPSGLSSRGYHVHPALLDAAFQVVAATVEEGGPTYLPQGVGAWQVFGPADDRVLCHTRLRGQPGDAVLEADLELADAQGRVFARLEGLRLSCLEESGRLRLADSLLQRQWIPAPLTATPSETPNRWLILAGADGVGSRLAATLEAHGHSVMLVSHGPAYQRVGPAHVQVRAGVPEDLALAMQLSERPFDGVVHLWSLDTDLPSTGSSALEESQMLSCGSALHLTQALVRLMPSARLWFVTRGAQAVTPAALQVQQAALWGLGLVISQEHPELCCRCVDLPPQESADDVVALQEEILRGSTETCVGWRDGRRFAARLVSAADALAVAGTPLALRDDATYLITGGLGALGLEVAQALIEAGARHLVLVGRRGAAGKDKAITALAELGAEVFVAQTDVSREWEVRALIDRIQSDLPPLRGIIHAAGVLDDGALASQSVSRLQKVLAPKMQGAWHLHSTTLQLPLDFFVCFSSVASLMGSPGQSNYAAGNAFLDALAHHRRALGLPAISLNWGAWAEAGMAATAQTRARLTSRGVSAIEIADGLDLLRCVLRADPLSVGFLPAQLGVAPVHWPRFLSQFPTGVPSLFAVLADEAELQHGQAFAETLVGLPRRERATALRAHLADTLGAILGFGPSGRIGSQRRFFDLGLDSLTAVEFRNRLQASLSTRLPATLALDYPTLEALGDHLVGSLLEQPGNIEGTGAQTAEAGGEASDLDELSHEDVARLLANELGRGDAHVN